MTLLTLPAALWATQVASGDFLQRPSGLVVVFLAALAVLAAAGRPVRTGRDIRILLIGTVATAVLGLGWLLLYRPGNEFTLLFPRGSLLDLIQSQAPTLIALVVVTVVLLARRRTLAAAMLLAAGPWLAAGIAQPVFILLAEAGLVVPWPFGLLVPFALVPVVVAVARRLVPSRTPERMTAPPAP